MVGQVMDEVMTNNLHDAEGEGGGQKRGLGVRHTHVIITVDKTGINSSWVGASTIKYYNQKQSFANNLLLPLDPELLLQLLLVLRLLPLQLALEVRVAQHVVLAEAINLEVGVVGHPEAVVLDGLPDLDLLGQILVDHLLDLPAPALEEVGLLELVLELVVELEVHEVAVHVLLEHAGVEQVLAAQLGHLLPAHELVLVVHHLAVLLLQLLSDVVHVRHPLGPRAQLRHEVAADAGLLEGGEQQPAVVDHREHVDGVVGLDAGEELALGVGDLDLLLVAEEDVLGGVGHEVDGVDGLVVGGPNAEQLAVEPHVVEVQHRALASPQDQPGAIALDVGDGRGRLQLAGPPPLPEVPDLELVPAADQHVELLVEVHGADGGVGVKGGEELALLEAEAVDLVDGGRDAEVGVEGAVLEVARAVRDARAVVGPVLRVEVDGAVVLRHHDLAVVVGEDPELDDLAVEAAQALEGELCGVVDLELRRVDAGGHDVALVARDLHLARRNLELEVLDELDPPPVLLVVPQRLARLLRLLHELRVRLTRRHVVRLHPVDLSYLVHQQPIITNMLFPHSPSKRQPKGRSGVDGQIRGRGSRGAPGSGR